MTVDHLVVGSADLETGMCWVEDRLGVRPVLGGVHDGFGTQNALVGLGWPYLEVLACDPAQPNVESPLAKLLRTLSEPRLLTVALATTDLRNPVVMSRVRPDGDRMEWELEFTSTPLLLIDWKDTPRPSGLPDGGQLTSLSITTPDPELIGDLPGVVVRKGTWHVEVAIDGKPL